MLDFKPLEGFSFGTIKEGEFEAVKHGSVIDIIAYELDESGAVLSVVLNTIKQKTKGLSSEYLLEGTSDDKPLLSRTKEIAKDAGLQADSLDFEYLGEMYPSMRDMTSHYLFAVNLTGVEIDETRLKAFPLSKILKMKEATVQATFLRLFFHLYKTQIKDGNSQPKTEKSSGEADGSAES